MKRLLFIATLMLLAGGAFAQFPTRNNTPATLPPPIASRDVSGIVKDESGQTVIGALVTLKSKNDTLRGATNDDGVFIFKGVKQNIFSVSVASIGYQDFVKKYLLSDASKNLVLDPIVLKTKSNELNEVKINGTPSIVYKVDTIEYKASDYHVRENATLDELLKKMEGMEVGSDGTLTSQGTQITKAKLNGKEYAGGDVAQAIQNLPADIIEKVQIVDDYGDQAARTGIKDGDPQKILNVTTKADRSVGTTGRATAQDGNDDRYNAQIFLQRINANQQIGIIGFFRNTVTGVANSTSTGGGGNGGGGNGGGAVGGANAVGGGTGSSYSGSSAGMPGTTKSASPTFSYRDQWSKNVQVIASYNYNFSDNNSINQSYGQTYTAIGTNNFTNNNTTERDAKGHTVHFEIDDDIDKQNYLQINPTYTYSQTTTNTNSLVDNTAYYTNDFEHYITQGVSTTLNKANSMGVTALYLHLFKKPLRNISLQLGITHSNTQANSGNDRDYRYYNDATETTLLRDSAVNLLSTQKNLNTTYQVTMTYSEPLSSLSLLEFRGDSRRSVNDVTALQDTVLANGQLKEETALDNIYHYTTEQSHLAVTYRYNGKKVFLTLGAQAIPYSLSGTKIDNSTGEGVTTTRSTFKLVPAFRFGYTWSTVERFQVTYSGAYTEPNFQYLQPFTDRSDPNNIKVGNPDLNPSFANNINALYNHYYPNSRVNISLNGTATFTQDMITTNTLLDKIPLPNDPITGLPKFRTINEIHYINLQGEESLTGRYSFSKQLSDRRYNFTLNGFVYYGYNPAMSQGELYHTTEWHWQERFGPRINPNENIEVNPYVSYDLDKTFTTALNAVPTVYKTTSLAIDGRMWFLKTFQFNYSATKSFTTVSATNTLNTSPFVLNVGFLKEFLPRRNLIFTFNVYDILHQNNALQQQVSTTGVTNTLSNSLSRYFLVGLQLNLQKWSGTPTRNGREMIRRGDGSFIY